MRYAFVIEKAEGNYSAYGETVKDVEAEIREAIRFRVDSLNEDGLPIPRPAAVADYVEA